MDENILPQENFAHEIFQNLIFNEDNFNNQQTEDNQQQQEPDQQAQDDPFKTLKEKLRGSLGAIIECQPRLSPAEFLLNSLTLVTHFRMNMSQFEGVMKLVNTLFVEKVVPDTRYLLDKLFKSMSGIHYHFVCSDCLDYIGEFDNTIIREVQCKNASCQKVNEISNLNDSSFFVTFDLPSQIEILLSKDNVFDNLKNPYDLVNNEVPLIMRDLYDGSVYQKFVASLLPRTDVRHITMCFSVDGAALYTSSSCQIWPLFVSVLELPPKIRDHNLLLGGLWFSKCHAKQDVFLIPFAKECQKLSDHGFQVTVRGEIVKMKAHLLCCCADAPARAGVQAIHQHGGGFCCHWCLHPSENRQFAILDYVPQPRTEEELITDGTAAMVMDGSRDNSVNGVTGLSPLLNVKTMDMVDGIILEYFHACAHGICKSFLKAWLGEDGCDKTILYYIGTPLILEKLNSFLDSIKLPVEARRSARKLTEVGQWKGREFENFILYTSIPLLRTTLRPRYLQHWMKFVQAMHFLLQEEATESEFKKAEDLLLEFGREVANLYPDRYLTYNLHIVTWHLVQNCRRWGPAWCINGYSFEAGNKLLKGQIHANLGVASQVCRAQSHFKSLEILQNEVATAFSDRFRRDIEKKTDGKCIIISEDKYHGPEKRFKPTRQETFLCHQKAVDPDDFVQVSKLVHRSRVFTATSRSKEFYNNVALLQNGDFFLIKKIIVSQEQGEGFLIGNKIVTVPAFTLRNVTAAEICVKLVSYIHQESSLVLPSDLKIPCARFTLPHGDFVIKVPNVYNTT